VPTMRRQTVALGISARPSKRIVPTGVRAGLLLSINATIPLQPPTLRRPAVPLLQLPSGGAVRPAPFCFAQQLARLSVDEMQSGAGWADDPLILVFRNIWIAIQLVLDVDANRRAPENKMGHQSGYDGPANRIMI